MQTDRPSYPSSDELLHHAWIIMNPAMGESLRSGAVTLNGKLFDAARLALEWEREGVSIERISEISAKAEADWQPFYLRGNEPTKHHPPGNEARVDISKLKI